MQILFPLSVQYVQGLLSTRVRNYFLPLYGEGDQLEAIVLDYVLAWFSDALVEVTLIPVVARPMPSYISIHYRHIFDDDYLERSLIFKSLRRLSLPVGVEAKLEVGKAGVILIFQGTQRENIDSP